MKESTKQRKIAVGLIAGLASVSVLLGGVFDSSKELLEDYPQTGEDVVESINELSKDGIHEATVKKSVRQAVKNLLYKIPVKVRAVLFVPFWFIGSAILSAFELALSAVVAPLARLALGFGIQTLLLFGVIGLCIKILFPDLPWSKIFSKKLFLSVLFGSIFMSLCDIIVPHFWDDYRLYRTLGKVLLGLFVAGIILRPFIRKKLKGPASYEIVYEGKVLG